MGRPVHFEGENFTFGPPRGEDELSCGSLWVMADGVNNVSCWKLSDAELEEINKTGCVFLNVKSGRFMFPVFVGSENEINPLVADGGHKVEAPTR